MFQLSVQNLANAFYDEKLTVAWQRKLGLKYTGNVNIHRRQVIADRARVVVFFCIDVQVYLDLNFTHKYVTDTPKGIFVY